jgi:hypothetical protein
VQANYLAYLELPAPPAVDTLLQQLQAVLREGPADADRKSPRAAKRKSASTSSPMPHPLEGAAAALLAARISTLGLVSLRRLIAALTS